MRKTAAYTLRVNGEQHVVTGEGDTPLIYFLRNDLALNSPKFGCGLGECGACTVIVDGAAARSCALPLRLAAQRDIITLEGLGSTEAPHVLQQAFVDAQAAQCGYCIAGMIMTAKAFLDSHPAAPDEAAIRDALRFNLCRCGTHLEIVQAVAQAARGWRKNADNDARGSGG